MTDHDLSGWRVRAAAERAVLSVSGADAAGFLQGLLSNDIGRIAPDSMTYAGLLTPQGKVIADMLIARPEAERFLLDLRADDVETIARRLTLYKLRAKVEIARSPTGVVQLWRGPSAAASADPPIGRQDPRAEALGRRALVDDPQALDASLRAAGAAAAGRSDYDALRVESMVPELGPDFAPETAFPLEYDFERLNGVDFRKGCYVGQEVTARMKHKTELKKRVRRVRVSGGAPAEDREIRLDDGRPAGRLGTVAGATGLALLRTDREAGPLTCGDAAIVLDAAHSS